MRKLISPYRFVVNIKNGRIFVNIYVTSGIVAQEFFPFDFLAYFRNGVRCVIVFEKKASKVQKMKKIHFVTDQVINYAYTNSERTAKFDYLQILL